MKIKLKDVLETYKCQEAGKKALKNYIHLFPIRGSERLAGIIADLTGDGHFQGEPKYRLDYCSKNINELKRFEKEIEILFGIKGKIRENTTNIYGKSFNIGINCKPIGRILKLCETPAGAKVLSEFKIPQWVTEKKIFFRRYINRLFSCEGCVDEGSKCIELKMYKALDFIENGKCFFEQIKLGLNKYFGIKTTNIFLEGRTNTRKDGIKTKGIRLKIKNKISLIKFKKKIGFENKEKQAKLNKIISQSFSQN